MHRTQSFNWKPQMHFLPRQFYLSNLSEIQWECRSPVECISTKLENWQKCCQHWILFGNKKGYHSRTATLSLHTKKKKKRWNEKVEVQKRCCDTWAAAECCTRHSIMEVEKMLRVVFSSGLNAVFWDSLQVRGKCTLFRPVLAQTVPHFISESVRIEFTHRVFSEPSLPCLTR